jgi:hypothetical protein
MTCSSVVMLVARDVWPVERDNDISHAITHHRIKFA